MSANPQDAFDESKLTPHRSLAAALSPIQTSLVRTRHGWSMEMTAIGAAQIATRWASRLDPDSGSLLFDVEQGDWRERHGPSTLAAIAQRLSICPITQIDANTLVLDDQGLIELTGVVSTQRLRVVRVDGPIEPRDAKAIADAARRGESPLAVELRAVAAAEVKDDRHAVLHVRDRFDAIAVLAAGLRDYTATLLPRTAGAITSPPTVYLERLLSVSGTLTVRPIETEVYPTLIDIGMSTRVHGKQEPADRSLIFDIVSRTWHDEE